MKKLLFVPLLLSVFSSAYANYYPSQNSYHNQPSYSSQVNYSQPSSRQGYSSQGQGYSSQGQGQGYTNQGQGYCDQGQQGYSQQGQGASYPQGKAYYPQGQGASYPQGYPQGQGYHQGQSYPSQGNYSSQGYERSQQGHDYYPQEHNYYNPSSQGQQYSGPQDGSNQNWYSQEQNYYNEGRTTVAKDSSDKYPQDRATSEKDRELNAKIRDKITGWLTNDYKNISLKTANGIVSIEGNVATVEAKKKLNDEIRKINGVSSINDFIQVKDQDTREAAKEAAKYPQDRFASDADREINNKIRDKISGWFTNEYKNIALNTSNGNVSISGYVDSLDAQKKLTDEVRKIEGVKAVSNNTQVRK